MAISKDTSIVSPTESNDMSGRRVVTFELPGHRGQVAWAEIVPGLPAKVARLPRDISATTATLRQTISGHANTLQNHIQHFSNNLQVSTTVVPSSLSR